MLQGLQLVRGSWCIIFFLIVLILFFYCWLDSTISNHNLSEHIHCDMWFACIIESGILNKLDGNQQFWLRLSNSMPHRCRSHSVYLLRCVPLLHQSTSANCISNHRLLMLDKSKSIRRDTNCHSTDNLWLFWFCCPPAGGIITLSITWIIPLLAGTSASTTVAASAPTVTTPSVTVTVGSSPFAAVTVFAPSVGQLMQFLQTTWYRRMSASAAISSRWCNLKADSAAENASSVGAKTVIVITR